MKKQRKLRLSKLTIRVLDDHRLGAALGGVGYGKSYDIQRCGATKSCTCEDEETADCTTGGGGGGGGGGTTGY